MAALMDLPCIDRPGFLWFKTRRHEPLESANLSLWHSYGRYSFTHPVHVRIDRTQTSEGRVVHVVGLVCRHCLLPYWERWQAGSFGLSWMVRDEVDPEEANDALGRAHLWWRTDGLVWITSYGSPIVSQDKWPTDKDDDAAAAVWEYLLNGGTASEAKPCAVCGFPLIGKEQERPCRCCVAQGRAKPGELIDREAFLKP